jgi:riboflavin-specific deaminase-like protein
MEAFEGWLSGAEAHRRASGRPLVTLTYAQSLDGSLTGRAGQPTRISGPESQRLTHRLRAMHTAILVGVGTILADDPQLTVRLVEGESPQPVVLDSRLRIPAAARVLASHPKAAWIAVTEGYSPLRRIAIESGGGRVLVIPGDERGRVNLGSLLDCLGEMEVNSLMVEGGAQVISSFLSQALVDLVVLTIAPIFMGGLKVLDEGILETAGKSSERFTQRLVETGHIQMGEDLVVWGKLANLKAN